jgi:hypothetical protein
VRALRSGEWWLGKGKYERGGQPAEYWFHVVFSVLTIPMLAWSAASLGEGRDDTRVWQFFFPFFVGLPAAFWLVRSLQTGSTGIADLVFEREQEPKEFWTFILFHLALIALAAWTAMAWGPEKPLTFSEQAGPVVAAVRQQMPGQNLRFHRVRVDGASEFVCGEVELGNGERRRFFGLPTSADVVVEDESLPNFGKPFLRLCGGGVGRDL